MVVIACGESDVVKERGVFNVSSCLVVLLQSHRMFTSSDLVGTVVMVLVHGMELSYHYFRFS